VSRATIVIMLASTASVALVATYLALGGGSYRTTPVADPCAPRAWSSPHGVEATLQQIALSTADGAACSLHVSREDLVLALASGDDLQRFAAQHHLSNAEVENAVREGLTRAVDDAENAGAISGSVARPLRFAADHLPIAIVLDVLQGASSLLGG
jgi:hypothetical protein